MNWMREEKESRCPLVVTVTFELALTIDGSCFKCVDLRAVFLVYLGGSSSVYCMTQVSSSSSFISIFDSLG